MFISSHLEGFCYDSCNAGHGKVEDWWAGTGQAEGFRWAPHCGHVVHCSAGFPHLQQPPTEWLHLFSGRSYVETNQTKVIGMASYIPIWDITQSSCWDSALVSSSAEWVEFEALKANTFFRGNLRRWNARNGTEGTLRTPLELKDENQERLLASSFIWFTPLAHRSLRHS